VSSPFERLPFTLKSTEPLAEPPPGLRPAGFLSPSPAGAEEAGPGEGGGATGGNGCDTQAGRDRGTDKDPWE